MLRSLHTAATGMEAQQLKMDVISNNLANAGTTGFKKARAEFEDLLSETIRGVAAPDARGGAEVAPLQVGLGVRTGTTTRAFSQGDMINTGNPLDIAIEGQGFLKILRANGEVAYTRAGNLRVDATGRLTTQRGELIDPGVTIPADATNIIVRPDGAVIAKVSGRDEPQEVGTLELNTFPNPGGLLALGYNLFSASAASGDAVQGKAGEQGNGTFSQGFLESANVRAVEEMIDMISTQRAYELNSKVIQTADQMLQRLTSLR
jgi:flagellar basal-body rod protein FlgG